MTDVLSNYAGNKALTDLLNGTTYVALHETDPTAAGLLATEVAGGGYVRQPTTFAAATGKTRVNNLAQIFPGMPACTVRYLGVWDAISAGNMIWTKILAPEVPVLLAGQFLVPIHTMAISL